MILPDPIINMALSCTFSVINLTSDDLKVGLIDVECIFLEFWCDIRGCSSVKSTKVRCLGAIVVIVGINAGARPRISRQ